MNALRDLSLEVKISTVPNEVADATPFPEDQTHASYDPEAANRFWRVLLQSDRVFKVFRSRFVGKCSPVHFFWGAASIWRSRVSPAARAGAPWRSGSSPGHRRA